MNDKTEIAFSQPENYRQSLDAILSRQLTPETIDTYASDALDDLADLTERATERYRFEPTIEGETYNETEDKAYDYFGLGELESSLDHVADLAESIHSIDEVIKNAHVTQRVIVPPNRNETTIQAGDGSFGEKNTINRLKTTLFILQQDFGVDIHDQERFKLESGGTEGIMRNSSYNWIHVPELKRTILVCDEEGNVSFVFDDDKLALRSKEPLDLMDLSKDELDSLIESYPGIGRRIVYSKYFIANIKQAIGEEMLSNKIEESVENVEDAAAYLQVKIENAPEGYLNTNGMMKLFGGVSYNTIRNVIKDLGEALGEPVRARFGSRTADAFSPAQQEIVRQWLDDHGLFTEKSQEGYQSIYGMARRLKLNDNTVGAAVEALGDRLGEYKKARFSNRITNAYSPVQQDMVVEYLKEIGALTEEAPEGYMSIAGMAKELGVSHYVVVDAISELGEEVGEPIKAKFKNLVSDAYSPIQRQTIRNYLQAQGLFAEEAPAGYKTIFGIARDLGIAHDTVGVAIESLSEQLGKPIKARFNTRIADAFSPLQQQDIKSYLESKGVFVEKAPDGYVSMKGMIKRFHAGEPSIRAAIADLGEGLGPVLRAKISTTVTDAFSPAQQEMIEAKVEANKRASK